MRTTLPGCKELDPNDCELLGAPVGFNAIAICLGRLSYAFRSMAERLRLIDRHDALALLCSSLGHPRTIYNLRSGACFQNSGALARYDTVLRDVLCQSICIDMTNDAWDQATLPPENGGIGLAAVTLSAAVLSCIILGIDGAFNINLHSNRGPGSDGRS